MGDPRLGRGFNAYLLRKVQRLKLKMYQEKGHPLPHLHVDHGREHHSASFSLDPPKRLEGRLGSREEAIVLAWIAAHKDQLLAAWRSLQDGAPDMALLAELRGGA
ncbi:hypothetical protein Psesu_1924 [Pseudoxanthomonas suwonensis 11-1]|uniref:DUF4160 domain-containing protein n=2 Tax=Pseudoxanthomonas suwonensis TaxID=314722 RepID=E6WU43_PSEUU|nr:hypothetical protein Psesu_1924 [Pseudoxanthomonas suwonensis 11-1]